MAWNNAKLSLLRAVMRLSIDESITVENFDTPGQRINGRWANPASVTAAMTASVQPASGRSKQLLSEGLRNTDAIEVWATSELLPLKRAEGKPPSLVHWKGDKYSVEVLEDWYQHGRYWFAVCSKVDQ